MKIIYDKDLSGNLAVYIHCKTAGDYYDINNKMYVHSEYDTEWDQLMARLVELKYFNHYDKQELKSAGNVIILLEFISCSQKDMLIKELNVYLEGIKDGHCIYEVKFRNLDN